jgi:hypothetical protein
LHLLFAAIIGVRLHSFEKKYSERYLLKTDQFRAFAFTPMRLLNTSVHRMHFALRSALEKEVNSFSIKALGV